MLRKCLWIGGAILALELLALAMGFHVWIWFKVGLMIFVGFMLGKAWTLWFHRRGA